MGQLGELAKQEAEKRKKAGVEDAALAGLKKVTIVGGAKTPQERAQEEANERHKQAAAKAKAKGAAKKASTSTY